jgi:serine/threonine protein kinase/WD40 repeat protein
MNDPAWPEPLARRLDAVCDRFEAAWRAVRAGGPPPLPEDYLAGTAGPERELLRQELLQIDDHYRPRPPGADGATPALPPSSSSARTLPLRFGRLRAEPSVPGYEILGELGRGGMGVVYKARHLGLNRVVALKMLLGRAHAGAEEERRFQAEARALAQVRHPNVVAVHDYGSHDGLPYLALEYVEGGSLAGRLAGAPLPPRAAAELLAHIADAVQAIHDQGVLHRDLKPSNVLLHIAPGLPGEDRTPGKSGAMWEAMSAGSPGAPCPKISDFGLSRRLDSGDGPTPSGAVIGTPAYMAPEQAVGAADRVGPASDVYSLGVLLYELLTGRVPLRGASVAETLELVRTREPVPPRQLQPTVPRDLETICLKCLQKEPARRYAAAKGLADDLRRFLDGRAVLARPAGPLERAWRWCRRHRALSALCAVTAAAAAALLGLGLWFSERVGAARGEAEAADGRARAAQQLADAREYFGRATGARERLAQRDPGWTWAALDDLERAARLPPAREELPALRSLAAACLAGVDVRPAGRVPFEARSVAFHPDGKRLALGQFKSFDRLNCCVRLVDLDRLDEGVDLRMPAALFFDEQGFPQDGVWSVAFSPDGRWLAAGARSGRLHRWDLSRRPPELLSWEAHRRHVTRLAFGRDGALFSEADDGLRRWDVATGRETCAPFLTKRELGGLAVHPLDGWLVCDPGDRVERLAADTLRPLRPALHARSSHGSFFPDGRHAVWCQDNWVRFHNPSCSQPLSRLRAPDADQAEERPITDLALSPDGALLLTASEHARRVRLWEVAGGRLAAELVVADGCLKMAFHPDGRSFAVTAGKEVRLYEVGGLREQTVSALQGASITGMALAPDGRSLACLSGLDGADHGEATLWPLTDAGPALPKALCDVRGFDRNAPGRMAFSPDSRWLAFVQGRTSALALCDAAGAEADRVVTTGWPDAGDIHGVAFGPDGKLWAAGSKEVRAWDVRSGKEVVRWMNDLAAKFSGLEEIRAVAPGPDLTAAACLDGQVRILRAGDRFALVTRRIGDSAVNAAALNASGSLAAVGTDRGELRLLRLPGGEVVASRDAHADRVEALAFSGDELLASGGRGRKVILWRWDGSELHELLTLPMPAPVRALAFHPDGARLFVLLDKERAVRVWRLDRLARRLTALGLGDGLPSFEPADLPPAADLPKPTPPVRDEPAGPNGLKEEWFGDRVFRRLVRVRHDRQAAFDADLRPSDPLASADDFAVRWSGWLKAPRPGRYTLWLDGDGVQRLWLDDRLILDHERRSGGADHKAAVDLTARPHALRVEWVPYGGKPSVRLRWAQDGGFADEAVPAAALFHDREDAARAAPAPR